MNDLELQKQIEFQQQVAQLENLVKGHLSNDAISRYGNLKSAHPEKAMQALVVLSQMIQSGQISDRIDDEMLKNILIRMQPEKREFKIRRK